MKRKNSIKNLLALGSVLFLASCATIVRKEFKQEVTFNAKGEKNVDLYIDGEYKGQAPQTVTLDAREAYEVKYAKEGMEPNVYRMRGDVQGKYVLGDIVMGGVVLGWVPLIVDGVTDKWRSFDSQTIDYRYSNFDWKAGSYKGPGEQTGNENSDITAGGDLNDPKNDFDGDGVLNKDDLCPTVPGSKKFSGCVNQDGLDAGLNDANNKWGDIDKDGILNKDDKCPIRKGTAEFGGCPNKNDLDVANSKWATGDSDNDGIVNINDACSSVPGVLKYQGCPDADAFKKAGEAKVDTDGDGLPDAIDDCPEIPGLVELKGCPDSDGDLVPDHLDDCPEVKGLKELKGCPQNGSGNLGDDIKDTDGDGVPDNIDKCPTVKGLTTLQGCPKVEDSSHGEDGKIIPKLGDHGQLTNWRDIHEEDLPDVSGKMFEIKNLNFETGSATIKSSSYTELNDVVDFMKRVPSAKFDVEGHTDSQGSETGNLSLSQKRAKSVVAYLVSKGISQSRLEDHGYGEAKPVATNETADGRAINRRVEFHFK